MDFLDDEQLILNQRLLLLEDILTNLNHSFSNKISLLADEEHRIRNVLSKVNNQNSDFILNELQVNVQRLRDSLEEEYKEEMETIRQEMENILLQKQIITDNDI